MIMKLTWRILKMRIAVCPVLARDRDDRDL